MAARHDLVVYQGDDHTWPLVLSNIDSTQDPAVKTPFDLTGWTLLGHVRQSYADDDKSVDAEFTFDVTDAPNGAVTMSLDRDSTSTLSGRYKWDLEAQRTSDGYRTTLLFGNLKVRKEVTRE